MTEGATVANAFVQIMPSMDGATENITKAILPGVEEAGAQAGGTLGSSILEKLSGAGSALAKVGGVIAGAVAAKEVGKALLDIGAEFDAMTDTIVIGTGASGEALEGLTNSAKNIATTVPTSFENAGQVVADLSARMDLFGGDLEAVGGRVVALGNMLDKDINVETLTGAFNAFGVANDEAADKMDYLFNVSQKTGADFDKLTQIIEQNAPALQNLGFTFEESANMAALLDKAGMDASGTMAKMSKGLVSLAQPGEDAAQAYQRVLGEMEGFIEAGDTAAALDIASQVFGTRGAAQFVGALQSGALSMDELKDASLGAGDGILDTFEATADWPERWELIQNKSKEALEPLGGALMDGVTKAMESMLDIMDQIDPAVFEELGTVIGDVLAGAVDIASAAFEYLWENKDLIAGFFTGVGAVIETLVGVLVNIGRVIQNFVRGAITFFKNLATNVSTVFNNIRTTAQNVWNAISTTIGNVVRTISTTVSNVFKTIGTVTTNIFNGIKNTISSAINTASSVVSNATRTIQNAFSAAWNFVSSTTSTVFNGIRNTIGNALNAASTVVSSVTNTIKNTFGSVFGGIAATVQNIFNGIKTAITNPIETAKNAIKTAIDAIKGFFSFNITWPKIKLPHFKINGSFNPVDWISQGLPNISVEWYAKGGYVDGATLIGAGEAGGEAIVPFTNQRYMAQLADSIAEHMDPSESRYDRETAELLDAYLPLILKRIPNLSKRDFDRMAREAVA